MIEFFVTMKILWYSSYFLPYVSGITTTTRHIVDYLGKKHKISLLTFLHDQSLKKEEQMGKIRVFRMPWNFKVSKGFISFSSLSYFFHRVKVNDIVVINLPNVEALLMALIAKLSGRKVIVLYHCDVHLVGGIGSLIITAVVRLATFIQLVLSDVIVSYPDYLSDHWYSEFFQRKLKTCFPIADPPIVERSFQKKLLSQKGDEIWIGFAGRIAREKGIEYLIEAVHLLKEKLPIKLIFVGPEAVGEETYRQKINGLLKEHSISHRFLGMLSRPQLGAFYKTVDVVAVPSVNKTEAISIVQIEAMLEGTPVVATSLPGVRLPIQKTGMGILVAPCDSKSLASAIQLVMKKEASFATEEKIKKANELFSKQKIFSFYDSLLQ